MNAEAIYSNPKAAREAAVDIRAQLLSSGFQIIDESFFGPDAFFRAKKKHTVVAVEWLWGGGLSISLTAEPADEEMKSEVLDLLARNPVREEQVI